MSDDAGSDLLGFVGAKRYRTVLVDPPWRIDIRKGNKNCPEHDRLYRYPTMSLDEIKDLPVASICEPEAFLWLWVPNALLLAGIDVLRTWGFTYKQTLTWVKTDKRGTPSRKGIAFYFQPMTEFVLFGVRGHAPRRLMTSRIESNIVLAPRVSAGGHSRKPSKMRRLIEAACPGPRVELFARGSVPGWDGWGNQADDYVEGESPDGMRSKRLF